MGSFYQHLPQESESRWRPLVIGLVIVALAVAGLWVLSRKTERPAPVQAAAEPYAANLRISDLHLSTAQNFVGGSVTYLQGKLANLGDKTVTGAQVETIFRNSLGEVVQKEAQPLRVQETPLGHPDFVALSAAPLAPNGVREFRLTFEHISADWNQGFPELRFMNLTTR